MWSFLNVFLFLRIFHWGILRTRFICKEIESEYWCHVVVIHSDHSHILLFCIHDHILNIELLIPISRVGVDFCIKKKIQAVRL